MTHPSSDLPIPRVLPSHIGSITDLAWSPTGRLLAAVSSSGKVAIWDTTTGACLLSKQVTSAHLSAVAWSEQERCLLLGSATGVLCLLQISTRTFSQNSTFAAPITRISWSPNAVTPRFFVVAGQELAVFTRGRPTPHILSYGTSILDASWSPSGSHVALVCANGLVEVWDANTRRVPWGQAQHLAHPCRVTWDTRGKQLALGTQDGTVQFQDLATPTPGEAWSLSCLPIQEVHWCERGVLARSAGEIVFWQRDNACSTPQKLCAPVQKVALDPQGRFFATARPRQVTIAALS